MAKNKVPKAIAGYKVPKAIRKSPMLKALLASDIGRKVLANAITAGAGAAVGVLIGDHEEVADAAKTGTRKGARAMGIAGEAISRATEAAVSVVKESARDVLPKKMRPKERKEAEDHPSRAGVVH
ncbi:hypothetical protein [Rhizobium mesoamericanum]|uniref:hypothetical protein n=1 Tax=Rhizobium mesoamericanum TaxID=1079800 RepID=UPI00040D6551|nr:hypothetical protein [Rhizobium mesoamericanum]